VVVTVTVAEPLVSDVGLTEQCVAVAATAQERLTVEVKPFCGVTVMTLVYVAVAPALTVWEVVPAVASVKSGGPMTVKFTELDDAVVGIEFTTVIGKVPPTVGKMLVINCVELTKAAEKLWLLNVTLELGWKLAPVMVSIIDGLSGALVGLIELITGGGG